MHFTNCHTAEECKGRYRDLAKQLHPDKQGGSNAAFVAMQAEYEQRLRELLNNRPNPIEYNQLAQHLIEILKITQPHYYERVRQFGNSPYITLASHLIGSIAPKHKNVMNGILNLLK